MGKLVNIEGIGRRSVEKLIEGGCADLAGASTLSEIQLHQIGLRKEQVAKLRGWFARKRR
jgi:hypothetical protein